MIRNLILDWSGTLVDDLGPVHEATNLIFRHHGKPELLLEDFRKHFVLPYDAFYTSLLPEVALAEIDRMYHEHFVPKQEAVRLLPHAREFLEFCRESGRRMFLLSTIKATHFAAQSERLNVRGFFERTYVEVMDKRHRIPEVLAANDLDPAETAFVGDMAHDVETARYGGVMSVATLTGFDSLEKLAAADPDVIVRDLRQLRSLLEQTARDEIRIEELQVEASVGVPEAERAVPQRLVLSFTLTPEQDFRDLDDDLRRTVDYAVVVEEVKSFIGRRVVKLIETLADELAAHLLERFALREVRIELRKFILPETRYVAVRVARSAQPAGG